MRLVSEHVRDSADRTEHTKGNDEVRHRPDRLWNVTEENDCA